MGQRRRRRGAWGRLRGLGRGRPNRNGPPPPPLWCLGPPFRSSVEPFCTPLCNPCVTLQGGTAVLPCRVAQGLPIDMQKGSTDDTMSVKRAARRPLGCLWNHLIFVALYAILLA